MTPRRRLKCTSFIVTDIEISNLPPAGFPPSPGAPLHSAENRSATRLLQGSARMRAAKYPTNPPCKRRIRLLARA